MTFYPEDTVQVPNIPHCVLWRKTLVTDAASRRKELVFILKIIHNAYADTSKYYFSWEDYGDAFAPKPHQITRVPKLSLDPELRREYIVKILHPLEKLPKRLSRHFGVGTHVARQLVEQVYDTILVDSFFRLR